MSEVKVQRYNTAQNERSGGQMRRSDITISGGG